jgi:hypothetical protein
MKAANEMSAAARRDLKAAIKIDRPVEMAQAVVSFVGKYRKQLADLLGNTQLAALLAGAQEVASRMPPVPPEGVYQPPPPSLPPDAAQALLRKLEAIPEAKRDKAIYALPPDQQKYVRDALSAGGIEPPSFTLPEPAEGSPEGLHFPVIDEAVKSLREKNLVRRDEFDRMDAATRQKAFTVAGASSNETLGKIRDALADTAEEGADLETFREKVLADVEPSSFLSTGHLENVFRTNIQAAFSDGQMKVLSHPFVKSGFPYARYSSIDDDRVRHNHLALEKLGIDGGPCYRIDDPVFQTFRPPWDYLDRCSWFPTTVEQAAHMGVSEAKKWMESGVEPSPPAYVPMPPFRPPPNFQRSLNAAPLSIQLSMQGLDEFYLASRQIDAELGMVGDEWHGPKPPGEGWTEIAPGPRGGKRWKQGGQRPAAPAHAASAKAAPAKPALHQQLYGIYQQKGAKAALDFFQKLPRESQPEVFARLPPDVTKALTAAIEPSARPQAEASKPAQRQMIPRSEVRKSLSLSPVKKADFLGGGCNGSFLVTLEDGAKGVWKPAAMEDKGLRATVVGDYWRREVAASMLADVLGLGDLVPATSVRNETSGGMPGKRGGIGSCQEFVPDSKLACQCGDQERFDGEADLARAAAFDFLILNTDRHSSNWMLRDGKKIVLIDNGLAFPDSNDVNNDMSDTGLLQEALMNGPHAGSHLRVPQAIKEWRGKEQEVRSLLSSIRLSSVEVELTMGRFETLVSSAERGETLVDMWKRSGVPVRLDLPK